jgi:putative transcriptional regulator
MLQSYLGGDLGLLNRIKLARMELDLTQQQLAEAVGVTRQTINLIEKGNYNPSIKLCLAICYSLNKTLDDLFWIKENEK